MRTLELNSVELVEMNESELKEANGGFGWYPGYNQDAAAAGKIFWGAVDEFVDNFKKGFNATYKG